MQCEPNRISIEKCENGFTLDIQCKANHWEAKEECTVNKYFIFTTKDEAFEKGKEILK